MKQSVCYLRNRRDGYGPIKVAQGIVGYADLAFGDRVEPVLEAPQAAARKRLGRGGPALGGYTFEWRVFG